MYKKILCKIIINSCFGNISKNKSLSDNYEKKKNYLKC